MKLLGICLFGCVGCGVSLPFLLKNKTQGPVKPTRLTLNTSAGGGPFIKFGVKEIF